VAAITDDELVLLYRNGDADAFDTLFDRHYASVYNFARMMLRNREEAEDVLQDAFLAVVRTARRYEPRGSFRTWLMRIARNLCLNRIQAARARRRVAGQGGIELLDPPSSDPLPEEHLAMEERIENLRSRMEDLPDRQREALALYAFEDISYRDISAILDVPMGTVKTLIHRARVALAQDHVQGAES
jgi:RNA polymerase sigma-70 factor (ECF subfamily)